MAKTSKELGKLHDSSASVCLALEVGLLLHAVAAMRLQDLCFGLMRVDLHDCCCWTH